MSASFAILGSGGMEVIVIFSVACFYLLQKNSATSFVGKEMEMNLEKLSKRSDMQA